MILTCTNPACSQKDVDKDVNPEYCDVTRGVTCGECQSVLLEAVVDVDDR